MRKELSAQKQLCSLLSETRLRAVRASPVRPPSDLSLSVSRESGLQRSCWAFEELAQGSSQLGTVYFPGFHNFTGTCKEFCLAFFPR